MAAVTQSGTPYPLFNVSGKLRDNYYQITGVTTNTLDVGLITVLQVVIDPSTITAYAVTSLGNGQSRITFTSSGPFTNVNVQVIGQ